jgi:hypothetical protein
MSDHAIANAKAWLESIREMVAALDSEDGARDEAAQRIRESVLSVEVRDGWRRPDEDQRAPAEFSILLTTGGPALRLRGDLDDWCEPEAPFRLQWQDWGTPWTDYEMTRDDTLACAAFARCFWFGEA